MSEFTPTIEDLRNAWLELYTYPEPEVLAAQFDAALDAHDVQVRAEYLTGLSAKYASIAEKSVEEGMPTTAGALRTFATLLAEEALHLEGDSTGFRSGLPFRASGGE